MSHGIKTLDTQFGIEMAWHKLTAVRPELKRDEVFCQYSKQGLELAMPDGKVVPYVTDGKPWFAVICDDGNVIGDPIRESYRLFAPREGWDTITELLSGSRYTVASAGTIQNRAKWFISIELDEMKEHSPEGDAHKFTLNFMGGIDKSLSPVINLSAIRVVCANTLRMNLADESTYLFQSRLTQKRFDVNLAAAKPDLAAVVGMAAVFKAAYGKLGKVKATVDNARDAFAGYIALGEGRSFEPRKVKAGGHVPSRAANDVDELVSLFQGGIGNQGKTRADVLNAFTEFHTRGGADSQKDVWSRFECAEFGTGAERKEDFFSRITKEGGFMELVHAGKEALAVN